MRLWHYKLLPYLSRQRLLSQHRECCALRGKGWGKKHSVVDYVFAHSYFNLVYYHFVVMDEMEKRGFVVDTLWRSSLYRGKNLGFAEGSPNENLNCEELMMYPEHDRAYLRFCIELLQEKGETTRIQEMERLYEQETNK